MSEIRQTQTILYTLQSDCLLTTRHCSPLKVLEEHNTLMGRGKKRNLVANISTKCNRDQSH